MPRTPQSNLTSIVKDALTLSEGTGRAQRGQWNISNAARLAGIPRSTMSRYANQLRETGSVNIGSRYARAAIEKTPTVSGIQKAYNDIVISTYRQSGRNATLAAAKLGTTPQNVGRMVSKISRGKPAIKTPSILTKRVEKVAVKELDITKGRGIMTKVHQVKGKEFMIRDYKLEPDKRLPHFKRGHAYQVIMKGEQGGKKRTITTSLSKDPNSVMQSAINAIKEYKGFTASTIEIRVFSDLDPLD